MELPLVRITTEHQFEVAVTDTKFSVDVSELRPYLATQGNWCVVPLHLSTTKPLIWSEDAEFKQGFQLVSFQVLSGSGYPLSLVEFSSTEFERQGRSVFFFSSCRRIYPITHKSNLLFFELRGLDGREVRLPPDGKLLLGLALQQYS